MQSTEPNNFKVSRLLSFMTLVEFLVLLMAGGGLFFSPGFTTSIWPWELTPFNTRFLGAIYIASMTAVAAMLFVGRWSPARAVLRVILSFTLIVLAVSILTTARFNFPHWSVWVWFTLYVALPLNCAFHLWLYRSASDAHLTPLSPLWSRLLLGVGIVLVGYGAGLIIAPEIFSRFFPWTLDEFHSRLYSAAFVGGGIGLLTVAPKTTAWELIAAGAPLATLGIFSILGLVIVDAEVKRLVWTDAVVWVWLGAFAALAVLGIGMLVFGWQRKPRV
jgi:hypothetical protein